MLKRKRTNTGGTKNRKEKNEKVSGKFPVKKKLIQVIGVELSYDYHHAGDPDTDEPVSILSQHEVPAIFWRFLISFGVAHLLF